MTNPINNGSLRSSAMAFSLMAFVLINCQRSTKIESPVITGADTTFYLGEMRHYESSKCTLTPECDCCYGALLLESATSTFLLVELCVGGDSYYDGKYTITNGELQLTFNPSFISEEAFYNPDTITYTLSERNNQELNFKIEVCNGPVLFAEPGDLYEVGRPMEIKDRESTINQLKGSESYKRLKGKKLHKSNP